MDFPRFWLVCIVFMSWFGCVRESKDHAKVGCWLHCRCRIQPGPSRSSQVPALSLATDAFRNRTCCRLLKMLVVGMLPTEQGSFRLFRFAGIQVFLHWSWFIVALYEVNTRGREVQFPGLESARIPRPVRHCADARVRALARLPAGGWQGGPHRPLATRGRGVRRPASAAGSHPLEYCRPARSSMWSWFQF